MSKVELGATLYVPALNAAVVKTAQGAIPELRSMVICLEDSIRDDQVEQAEAAFAAILLKFQQQLPSVHVFVRPRDIEMLVRLLRLPAIETVRGFVLPKVTTANLPGWLSVLVHGSHQFMPTIEGEEAFDPIALRRLCDQLLPYTERVDAIRIGGNDILNLFGVRRSRKRTAYEGPLGKVIRDIASTFIPSGFRVAAPVFEHFSETDLLNEELELDVEHGLTTKTAIHPRQIALIQAAYRPTADDMKEARAILDSEAPAVFGSSGSMCEPATHMRWAGNTIQRAQAFGVIDQVRDAVAMVA